MARLERVGDTTELVTDDGIRLPWVLDERPEYGLTLPPPTPVATGPDALAQNDDFTRSVRSALDAGTAPRVGGLPLRAGPEGDPKIPAISLTPEQAQKAGAIPEEKAREEKRETARNFDRSREDAEKSKLRGGEGLESIDAQPSPGGGFGPGFSPTSAGPVRRIKGGPRLESMQITRGSGSAEDVAGLRQASERSSVSNREALTAQGVSEITERASQAEELGIQAEGLSEKLQNTRVQNAKAQLEHDSRIAELDNEREKLLAAEADPYRFWASKGAGTKILAAIGMLAGGLVAGLKGGENQVMKLVQQTMAEDKADRMARIKARQRGLQIRRDEHDKLSEALDADLAEQETTGRQLAAVAGQMRHYARTVATSNAALAAKVSAEADKYDLLARKEFADVNSKVGDRIVETIKNEPDRFVGGAAQPVLKPEQRERMVRLPNGQYGFARTGAQAKEAQDKLTPSITIIQGLKELQTLREQAGAFNVTPKVLSEVKQRMIGISESIAPMMAVQAGQGAMSDDERSSRMRVISDPEAILAGQADKAMQETLRVQQSVQNGVVRDYLHQDPDALVPWSGPQASSLKRE